jgi:hypothetical protein
MKLARYEVNQGNKVSLKCTTPDKVYLSKIFNASTLDYLPINGEEVIKGGRAFNNHVLPYEIEHLKPYYELYDLNYSLGSTSRGCPRSCGFCDVWRREGTISYPNSPIEEFWDESHKKVVDLAPNFFSNPDWQREIRFVKEHSLELVIDSGVDIRSLNSQNLKAMSEISINDLRFAFDNPSQEPLIKKGVELLREYGFVKEYTFYVLVGYDTDIVQDLDRVYLLRSLGMRPYIMRYHKQDSLLNHLARWVNGTYQWRKKRFSTYDKLKEYQVRNIEELEKGIIDKVK